jgi:hypothetical protein
VEDIWLGAGQLCDNTRQVSPLLGAGKRQKLACRAPVAPQPSQCRPSRNADRESDSYYSRARGSVQLQSYGGVLSPPNNDEMAAKEMQACGLPRSRR